MTHIKNIPHILKNGITHFSSPNANTNYIPIGDTNLIATRNNFILKNGMRLGDYIPFYFAYRTPMLYVMQKGFNLVEPIHPEEIIYCVTSVQTIMDFKLKFIFTNGHAVDKFSAQFTVEDIHNIDNILDTAAIKSKYWNDEKDLDKKRRKEAEFLVAGDIPGQAILGFVVYNNKAKNELLNYGIEENKILINSNYYF